jgi:hypothetical protein
MNQPLVPRQIIASDLDCLEAGSFQQLCKDLLPLLNLRFTGIRIYGGNDYGATTKGVPDLIVDLPDGNQIAVECSVKKDYWTKEISKTKNLKPEDDAISCFNNIKNLNEIVLVTTQDPPPDKKMDVIEKVKKECNNFSNINFIIRTEIIDYIFNNLDNNVVRRIIDLLMPMCAEILDNASRMIKGQIVAELSYEVSPATLSQRQVAVESAFQKYFDYSKTKSDAIQRLQLNVSGWRREIPVPGPVERVITGEMLNLPCYGEVWVIYGWPLFGKSLFVAQALKKFLKRIPTGMTFQVQKKAVILHLLNL